jgi:hypothetical protein
MTNQKRRDAIEVVSDDEIQQLKAQLEELQADYESGKKDNMKEMVELAKKIGNITRTGGTNDRANANVAEK